jgi:hypothetical protein
MTRKTGATHSTRPTNSFGRSISFGDKNHITCYIIAENVLRWNVIEVQNNQKENKSEQALQIIGHVVA